MNSLRLPIRLLLAICLTHSFAAVAASKTQTVDLHPGWNSVYLEVTPEPGDVETVFAGLPVRAVWRHLVDESPVRYVDNANALKPETGRWLTWVPTEGGAGEALKTLHAVHGGAIYLIDLAGTANATWTIKGRPAIRNLSWLNASYSLTGLCIDPSTPVTFAQYFNLSPAHQNLDIRRIGVDGRWTQIPGTTTIQRGEAYWIYSGAISSFQGAGAVKVDNRGLLDYGSSIVEQSIVLVNNTAASANFTLRLDPAEAPTGELSAGPLQLSVWRDFSDGVNYGWESLAGTKIVTVPANLEKTVRLAIRRADMIGQGQAKDFHSILRVAGLMTCQEIGLQADGFAPGAGGVSDAGRFAGLWVGDCVVDEVGLAQTAAPGPTLPTASTASLRLLVRVDANGNASLLREATILWLDGLTVGGIVTEPGQILIAANAAELAQLEAAHGAVGTGRLKGVSVRDDRTVPRRVSSVGFSFTDPIPMIGSFAPGGGQLAATVAVGYDDDRNPYKHRYHPDHDNLVDGTTNKAPEGRESYSFNRVITLNFSAADPDELRLPGWGDTLSGGIYEETLAGLHRYPINIKGTFRLSRIAALRP